MFGLVIIDVGDVVDWTIIIIIINNVVVVVRLHIVTNSTVLGRLTTWGRL